MIKTAKAYHIERQLNLSKMRSQFTDYKLVKREHSFLLYHANEQSFFYIKDYGSLVFINFDENDVSTCINKTEEGLKISQLPNETYTITISDAIDVDFDTIQVNELNVDVAHIIMLNLAQSVALMNYVNKVSLLLRTDIGIHQAIRAKRTF